MECWGDKWRQAGRGGGEGLLGRKTRCVEGEGEGGSKRKESAASRYKETLPQEGRQRGAAGRDAHMTFTWIQGGDGGGG